MGFLAAEDRKVFNGLFREMGMVEKKEDSEKKVEKKAGKPSWIKMKKEELEKIIVDLAKKGESPGKIGLILRDKHGVPKTRLFGKRICEILEEKGIDYKKERVVFEARVEKLKGHIEKNKHDYPASRALTKNLWVLNKLERQGK